MTASDPLVEFIRARLDEDQQGAQEASTRSASWYIAEQPPYRWGDDPRDDVVIAGGKDVISCNYEYGSIAHAEHIVRHDPARVLRGVEAKRQAIELWESNWEWSQNPACPSNQRDHYRYMAMGMRDMLVAMAGEWERHADYRDGWKS